MPALVLSPKGCRQKTREMCKKHISPVFEVKKKEKIKTFQSGNQQLETPLAQRTKLWYHIPDVGAGFPVGVSVSLAHLTSGDAERQLSSLPALPCPRRWDCGIYFSIFYHTPRRLSIHSVENIINLSRQARRAKGSAVKIRSAPFGPHKICPLFLLIKTGKCVSAHLPGF